LLTAGLRANRPTGSWENAPESMTDVLAACGKKRLTAHPSFPRKRESRLGKSFWTRVPREGGDRLRGRDDMNNNFDGLPGMFAGRGKSAAQMFVRVDPRRRS
jgi:hypothetical protein